MKVNRLAAFGLAAGLLGGGAAGLALGAPGLAAAQSDETTTTSAPESAGEATDPAAPADRPDKRRWMTDALAPLVANGTLDQGQADAVIDALDAARPAKGHRGRRGGHGLGGRGLDAAATALDMTAGELRTALRGGQALADVAQSQGVDPEAVVSAMVGEVETKLTEQVAAGRLTQARADEMLAKATERIRAFVNGEGKPFGFGHRSGPRRGEMPPAGEGSSSSSSSGDGGTTTA